LQKIQTAAKTQIRSTGARQQKSKWLSDLKQFRADEQKFTQALWGEDTFGNRHTTDILSTPGASADTVETSDFIRGLLLEVEEEEDQLSGALVGSTPTEGAPAVPAQKEKKASADVWEDMAGLRQLLRVLKVKKRSSISSSSSAAAAAAKGKDDSADETLKMAAASLEICRGLMTINRLGSEECESLIERVGQSIGHFFQIKKILY